MDGGTQEVDMRHLRVVLVLLKGADTEIDRIFVKEDIILNDDESIIMFRAVIYCANDIPLETKTCLANENFCEAAPVCLSKGDHLFHSGCRVLAARSTNSIVSRSWSFASRHQGLWQNDHAC